jgi:hypothetical protein
MCETAASTSSKHIAEDAVGVSEELLDGGRRCRREAVTAAPDVVAEDIM